jgi:hypothetical protein
MKLVKDSLMSFVDKALYYNKNLEEAYLWGAWLKIKMGYKGI